MSESEYPLVPEDVTYPNFTAPEELNERTGDPYIGGSLPDEPRMPGLQPGYTIAGISPMSPAVKATGLN